MNAYLFPNPWFRPLTESGAIMPEAYLQFYLTQTTTPTPVYADADLNTELPNPLVADDAGYFQPFYLDPAITYRVQLYDADDVLQPNGDVDPLAPPRDYPAGTTFMFTGSAVDRDAAYPPALWQVCDGTNGTYDMRGRFPIGVDGSHAIGSTGGGSYNTVTGEAGAVSAGVTGETTLDSTQMPVHGHRLFVRMSSTLRGNTRGFGFAGTAGVEGQIIDDAPYDYLEDSPAEGDPLIEPTGEGSPASHTHTTPSIPDHDHTFEQKDPPYIAIWFLMRRA